MYLPTVGKLEAPFLIYLCAVDIASTTKLYGKKWRRLPRVQPHEISECSRYILDNLDYGGYR